MDDAFFGEDFHFDPTLSYAGIPLDGLPSTAPHAEDTTPQFDRNLDWLDDFNFNDLSSNNLEANDIQSGNIHSSQLCPHLPIFPKYHDNGQSSQAPHTIDYLSVHNQNYARSRSIQPWGALQPRHNVEDEFGRMFSRTQIDRNSSICDPNFMLQDHMSPLDNNRGGDDITVQPLPFAAQFTTEDLGTLSQYPNADDTVSLVCSQTSCNSKCTSSVCEDEECSATGIPCNDPTCVSSLPPSQLMCLTHQMPPHIPPGPTFFHQPHTQPCNHTESEHLVARTLGELRAPGESYTHEKTPPCAISFDLPLAPCTQEQLDSNGRQFYVSPPLSTDLESSASSYPNVSLQGAPPTVATTSGHVHTCQWITNPNAPPGESIICGAQFADTNDFHKHMCEDHIDELTSANGNGFQCLWKGCSRKPHQAFATRGKLRRHISTHSAYKPFICKICNRGFSGQQALQQHERIHTGEKPFRCTFPNCKSAFKQKSALRKKKGSHNRRASTLTDISEAEFCVEQTPTNTTTTTTTTPTPIE
ncbi:hypothetical protein NPX13_g7454 [Xylaria arbuscula]|uniref:C2H2-type domain-containing protein n=1 Tax=Xylaria arbuscula TaxID=114810 RepID=A0A9W8TL63_9PEZI|nr:hypothetical protein NPX13_g7454 [Xylaria arbuscula]